MGIANLSGAAARTGILKKKERYNILVTGKGVIKFPGTPLIKRVPQRNPSGNDSR